MKNFVRRLYGGRWRERGRTRRSATSNSRPDSRMSTAGSQESGGQTPAPRRTSQDSRDEPHNAPTSEPITLQELISRSESLCERPDHATAWLLSLQPNVKDTSIPEAIVALDGVSTYKGTLCTFLEVLGDWLSCWSTPLNTNHDSKSVSDQITNATGHVVWLLRFTKDYINNAKGPASPANLEKICRAVIRIYNGTNNTSLARASAELLTTVSKQHSIPAGVLADTFKWLAANLVSVPRATDAVHECLDPLLNTTESLYTLFGMVRQLSTQYKPQDLRSVLGAMKIVRYWFEKNDGNELMTLARAEFVDLLHFAAKLQIFKFAIAILGGCRTVLSSKVDRQLDPPILEQLLSTIRLCLAVVHSELQDKVSTTQPTLKSTSSEAYVATKRYVQECQILADAVGTDIRDLAQEFPEVWLSTIIDGILKDPLHLPDGLVIYCLDTGLTLEIFYPKTLHWTDRCDWLLRKFLTEEKLASECRVRAVAILSSIIKQFSLDTENRQALHPVNYNMKNLCTKLQETLCEQLAVEKDERAATAFFEIIPLLATCRDTAQGGDEAAIYLIDFLKKFVAHKLPATGVGFSNALQATKALVEIFVDNPHSHPTRSIRAYEALTAIVNPECKFLEARLEAMKLLFRLRRNYDGLFYLTDVTDNQYIATALCKTRDSADAFDPDSRTSQRRSATNTISSTTSTYSNLWMQDQETIPPVRIIFPSLEGAPKLSTGLRTGAWLAEVIHCLQSDQEWETYSYCLVYLGSQLNNVGLFKDSLSSVVALRQIVCDQLVRSTMRDPPGKTGLRKSDIALCLYNILMPLIAYATIQDDKRVIQKKFGDDLVKTFLHGIASKAYEGTDRGCIHALSLCALQIPESVADSYPNMLDRVSTSMSKSYLTVHILEFLSLVATLPEVHSEFRPEEIDKIFIMCTQFLERARGHTLTSGSASMTSSRANIPRQTNISLMRPPYRATMIQEVGEPRYSSALAYHTIICWFLSLDLAKRKQYVSMLVRRLVYTNNAGEETIDEQSEVLIDMMQRTAFSDLGETLPDVEFAGDEDGLVNKASWIVGYSLITAEAAGITGRTQITKRQASGTTYAVYQQKTAELPPHHVLSSTAKRSAQDGGSQKIEMLPAHTLLQMVTTAAPTSVRDQPVALPDNEMVKRAISTFDRNPTVDSYKAGVIFLGPSHSEEHEFLGNQTSSADFDSFLGDLGAKVSLKRPLRFTSQGLEYPRDGEETIAWRDRVTEIVFLVTTMMPANDNEEPSWMTKKAHVGNCHVNIIFNRSGEEWSVDQLPSQFNSVNIVIAPSDATEMNVAEQTEEPDFYRVHVITKGGFPNMSPAAEPKIIAKSALGQFVRILAINANVFSQVWTTKEDQEFPSSWRRRLQEIKKLKERVGAREEAAGVGGAATGSATLGVGGGGRRTPVPRDEGTGVGKREGGLALQLDFGQWTS